MILKYTIPDGGPRDVLIPLKPCCSWIKKYYNKIWRRTNSVFKQQKLMNSALALSTVWEWINSNSNQQYQFIVNRIVTCIYPIIVFHVDISSFVNKRAQNFFKTSFLCSHVQGCLLMENKIIEWLACQSVYWLILHLSWWIQSDYMHRMSADYRTFT